MYCHHFSYYFFPIIVIVLNFYFPLSFVLLTNYVSYLEKFAHNVLLILGFTATVSSQPKRTIYFKLLHSHFIFSSMVIMQ